MRECELIFNSKPATDGSYGAREDKVTVNSQAGLISGGYALGLRLHETFLLHAGLGLTAAFVILRSINVYGDPTRWTIQKSALFTALSFPNTSKYPPSLLFLLMTLGTAVASSSGH
jgi:uncharacterized membrane protein